MGATASPERAKPGAEAPHCRPTGRCFVPRRHSVARSGGAWCQVATPSPGRAERGAGSPIPRPTGRRDVQGRHGVARKANRHFSGRIAAGKARNGSRPEKKGRAANGTGFFPKRRRAPACRHDLGRQTAARRRCNALPAARTPIAAGSKARRQSKTLPPMGAGHRAERQALLPPEKEPPVGKLGVSRGRCASLQPDRKLPAGRAGAANDLVPLPPEERFSRPNRSTYREPDRPRQRQTRWRGRRLPGGRKAGPPAARRVLGSAERRRLHLHQPLGIFSSYGDSGAF